jgi:hypothetical protein
MPKRTILVLLLSIVTVALSAADQSSTTARVFNLKNASVIEAFTAIEPLLSNDGSVTVQPSRGRITIQDSPEVVGRIASMMAELDRIPGEYRIEVELLEGLDVERAPELAPELDRRLHRMFPFKSYRRAGRTVFQGEFGQPTTASLSRSYRLSFLAEASNVPESTPWGVADLGNRTQVKWLRLDRLTAGDGGGEKVDELLRTTVFLSPRQKMIIGAGSSEDSASGLVLILTMHSVEDR